MDAVTGLIEQKGSCTSVCCRQYPAVPNSAKDASMSCCSTMQSSSMEKSKAWHQRPFPYRLLRFSSPDHYGCLNSRLRANPVRGYVGQNILQFANAFPLRVQAHCSNVFRLLHGVDLPILVVGAQPFALPLRVRRRWEI